MDRMRESGRNCLDDDDSASSPFSPPVVRVIRLMVTVALEPPPLPPARPSKRRWSPPVTFMVIGSRFMGCVYGGAQAKGRDREEKERRKGGGREEEDIGDLRGRGVRRETKGMKGGG